MDVRMPWEALGDCSPGAVTEQARMDETIYKSTMQVDYPSSMQRRSVKTMCIDLAYRTMIVAFQNQLHS